MTVENLGVSKADAAEGGASGEFHQEDGCKWRVLSKVIGNFDQEQLLLRT